MKDLEKIKSVKSCFNCKRDPMSNCSGCEVLRKMREEQIKPYRGK